MPEYLVHIGLSKGKRGTIAVHADNEQDAMNQARQAGCIPAAATLRLKPGPHTAANNPDFQYIQDFIAKQKRPSLLARAITTLAPYFEDPNQPTRPPATATLQLAHERK